MQLDKFIYGLRQSPLKFQQHLKTTLRDIGYKECLNDDCVMLKTEGKDISLLSIHVDDILQVSTSPHLGVSLKQSADRSHITLTQEGLIQKILSENLSHTAAPAGTPTGSNLFEETGYNTPLLEEERKKILSITMGLMYIARLTRPDILLPVTYLAARVHVATKADKRKLARVLRYHRREQLLSPCQKLQAEASCSLIHGCRDL